MQKTETRQCMNAATHHTNKNTTVGIITLLWCQSSLHGINRNALMHEHTCAHAACISFTTNHITKSPTLLINYVHSSGNIVPIIYVHRKLINMITIACIANCEMHTCIHECMHECMHACTFCYHIQFTASAWLALVSMHAGSWFERP